MGKDESDFRVSEARAVQLLSKDIQGRPPVAARLSRADVWRFLLEFLTEST